jgi:hypothetical protein
VLVSETQQGKHCSIYIFLLIKEMGIYVLIITSRHRSRKEAKRKEIEASLPKVGM